jgi:Uma2 family endonuclease
MSQATQAPPRYRTVAELLHRLGDIPPERVRLRPTPGEATERDLLGPDGRLCELVDGILVEKTMGAVESMLTIELAMLLAAFVKQHRLGIVLGPDGMVRLMPGLVRLPDIAFISWERLPGKRAPTTPILNLAPDLAVEVLSKGNTRAEMKRKLCEYFEAGVRVVWLIDPRTRTALVHTSPKASTKLDEGQALDGGDVLPGFALPLAELFECLDRGRDE